MLPLRVAIVAPFNSWSDSYSLCHVVREQREAFIALGWAVDVFVSTTCPASDMCPSIPAIPLGKMVPDRLVPEEVAAIAEFYVERLKGYDAVFFHDIVLQSHNVAAAAALHEVYRHLDGTCFHYLHSRPVPDPKAPACRQTAPDPHFIIYPNGSEHGMDSVIGTYRHDPRKCFAVVNPCDPLRTLGVSSEVSQILEHAKWRSRTIVQTYPVCSTRMKDKGVPHLIAVADILRNCGENPLFIVCNAHANGKREKAEIDRLYRDEPAVRQGHVVFTSRLGYESGIPRAWVQELMRASDVFVFPTVSEAGPLIMLEAASAGCFIAHNGGWCPSLDYYAPPGSASFHLPPVDAIERYEIRFDTPDGSPLVLRGEKAYRAACNKIVREVLSALKQSPSYQARQFVKTQASLPVYGNSLKQIILQARRIISHESQPQ